MTASSVSPLTATPDLLVVITTMPSADDARTLARALIDERLAACVNILPPMHSVYRWEEQVCDEQEVLCLIKTWREHLAALASRLQQLHPYEVPEVVVLQAAEASAAYASWARHVTGS